MHCCVQAGISAHNRQGFFDGFPPLYFSRLAKEKEIGQ
jgi:hypothetical protein